MKARESGLATVEFAIAGVAVMTILFSCVEVSRALFIWNTIGEATRAAARQAAISSVNVANIQDKVQSYPGIPGLADANVTVQYLAANGTTPNNVNPTYVSVAITGYQHTLLIPFYGVTITVPAFETRVPVESLGFTPP